MLAQWLKASCCGAKPIATAVLGQTRKFSVFRATSGLPQEADIVSSTRYFGNVPISDIAITKFAAVLVAALTETSGGSAPACSASPWPGAGGDRGTNSGAFRRTSPENCPLSTPRYLRALAIRYSASASIGPPLSARSRRTSSRTARRISSGSAASAWPVEAPPRSKGP
jgi:hypothetical protein